MTNEIYNKPVYSQKTAFWVGLLTVGLFVIALVLVLYIALGREEAPQETKEEAKQEVREVKTEEVQVEQEAVAGESATSSSPKTYVVQSGDTLFEIGLKFKVDWRSIAEANDIEDQGSLKVGQTLIIPAQ